MFPTNAAHCGSVRPLPLKKSKASLAAATLRISCLPEGGFLTGGFSFLGAGLSLGFIVVLRPPGIFMTSPG